MTTVAPPVVTRVAATVAPSGGYQGRNDRGTSRRLPGRSDRGTRRLPGSQRPWRLPRRRRPRQRPSRRASRRPRRSASKPTPGPTTLARVRPVVTEDNGFAALGLPERLVERLARDGITDAVPDPGRDHPRRPGRPDVLGRGRPAPARRSPSACRPDRPARRRHPPRQSKRPRALILAPTRELAMQVSDALEPFVHVLGLRHKLVAGGLSYEPQINALNRGVDILVATPGRLADLIDRGAVELDDVHDRRARRGRPDGRHGLPARGHRDPRPDPGGRPAAALLGDPRPGHRHAGRRATSPTRSPTRPTTPTASRHHDEPPRAAHRPAGQEGHHRRARRPRGPHHRLRPHPARRRPHRRAAARAAACSRPPCTAA